MSQILSEAEIEEVCARLTALGYRGFDKERLRKRLLYSRNWVASYGPEYLRFTLLSDEASRKEYGKLSEKQKQGLKALTKELAAGHTPEALHKRIYETARSLDLAPDQLFEAIYMVLIGKPKGPKAAAFLLALDPGFLEKRFL